MLFRSDKKRADLKKKLYANSGWARVLFLELQKHS